MNLHEQLAAMIEEQKRTNELLSQLVGGKAADASTEKTSSSRTQKQTSSKTAPKDEKPAITVEQATDAAMALKDAHGTAVVKAILQECKVAKLAEMTDAQAPSVYKLCIEKKDELDNNAKEALEDDI